jgi:hypothetical protein
MKNPKLKIGAAVLMVSVALSSIMFTGCKKDKKDPEPDPTPTPAPPTNTQKLTGHNYKMTALTVNPGIPIGGGVVVTDLYAQQDACAKDDLTLFNSNGTTAFDEGASKCDPNAPQTTTGTWVWNTDETVLTVTQTGSTPTSLKIITNDGTTLKGTFTEVDGGVTYEYTMTLTKQ